MQAAATMVVATGRPSCLGAPDVHAPCCAAAFYDPLPCFSPDGRQSRHSLKPASPGEGEESVGTVACMLELLPSFRSIKDVVRSISDVCHVSLLRPYYSTVTVGTVQPPAPVVIDGRPAYVPERVIEHREGRAYRILTSCNPAPIPPWTRMPSLERQLV